MPIEDLMDNYGHKVPEAFSAEAMPFLPQRIVHYQLQIRPRGPDEPLEFALRPVLNTPNPSEIETYVTGEGLLERMLGDPTPWDVDVQQQSYLVLELDPTVPNWFFAGPGMTSKAEPQGHESALRHVLAGEIRGGSIAQPGCKKIFLKVGHRPSRSQGYYFNLITVFVQGDKMMPVLFDPDVGNQGNGFPPASGG